MHKKDGIIYRLTSPSGMVYIGKTWYFSRRMNQHKADAKTMHKCRVLHKAIRKYGFDAFAIDILHSGVVDEAELSRLEIAEIARHNSHLPHGYNMTSGGEGASGLVFTAEHRQKIGAKVSAARKGVPLKLSHREAISRGLKGRVHSQETRNKLSTVAKRTYAQNPEHFLRMVVNSVSARKKPVIGISERTGRILFADSAMGASREFDFSQAGISGCCRGMYTVVKQFRWFFA